jgi:hypothetical protein
MCSNSRCFENRDVCVFLCEVCAYVRRTTVKTACVFGISNSHAHHHHHHHHHHQLHHLSFRPLGLFWFRIHFLKLTNLLDIW